MDRTRNLGRRLARAAQRDVGTKVLVATTFVALLAFCAAIVLAFQASTRHAAEKDAREERQLAANYLDRAALSSVAQQKVQLTWDDAFRAVSVGRDMAWADTYLGEFLWSNFHYDELFLVDGDGKLIRTWREGKPADPALFRPFAPIVHAHLQAMEQGGPVMGAIDQMRPLADTRWPFDAKGRPLTRWSEALVEHDGMPVMLTVTAVVPDTDFSLLRRRPSHLVAIRHFDRTFIGAMGADLLLDGLAVERTGPEGAGRNGIALIGEDGRSIGRLTWKARPETADLRAHLRPLAIAFVCFLLALLGGGVLIVRALQRALAEVRVRETQAQHMALHDEMTGLPNRTRLFQAIGAAVQAHAGQPDMLVAVAYFDIDNFKVANDTQGHVFGDRLIQQVARRCRKRLRSGDLLARFGGDEFVLLRVVPRSEDALRLIGEDVMAIFAAPFSIDGTMLDINASCGIACAPDSGNTAEVLLRDADIALYRAKEQGRARWLAFQPEMKDAVHQRHQLEVDLRRAIAGDELALAYQPIVEAADGAISGVEVLLRWRHPALGEISPARFVPIAEQSGLMQPLGWWLLRRVLSEQFAWPGLDMSVNLSPVQLMSGRFVHDLRDLLHDTGADPSRITFEITEGVLMERGHGVFSVLEEIKALGFRIALDDFGTGYSSLSYLRMFRFDRIKIDRAFVQNIETDQDAQAILRSIVLLGRSLRMNIVAEGVETPLQRQIVTAAGCDYIQGFLFWPALAAEEVAAILALARRPLTLRKAG